MATEEGRKEGGSGRQALGVGLLLLVPPTHLDVLRVCQELHGGQQLPQPPHHTSTAPLLLLLLCEEAAFCLEHGHEGGQQRLHTLLRTHPTHHTTPPPAASRQAVCLPASQQWAAWLPPIIT